MNLEESILPGSRREKMTRLRSLIAERMHESSAATAPVTIAAETDVTEIVSFRSKAKAQTGKPIVPSYNAILMRAVGRTLLNHPGLNCSIEGNELVYWDSVNIGIAVDTARGLLVPVVHNVNQKSLNDLAKEIEELAAAASNGKLLPDQFQGGTFTITNLGSYDVDFFTPIINYPQVGILGIGRMRSAVSMLQGQLSQRMKAILSLTFDHRAVDGGPAALFLKEIRQLVESTKTWLLD